MSCCENKRPVLSSRRFHRSLKLVIVQSSATYAQYTPSTDHSDGLLYLTTDRCTMTSTGNKKKKEVAAGKEISKKWQLRDESESESYSASEVHYIIKTTDESPVVTTREKSNDQEAAMATSPLPQSEEG
ncbi:hypothetical protein HAX54_036745 [Datura stramonium]|uniref:Uncharacterized protein n=1 Tax=Datura stramonium TaxID=4076 RepID=A0ABS8VKL6_DATST|nr:hypothetical protein [Datura stramonium]